MIDENIENNEIVDDTENIPEQKLHNFREVSQLKYEVSMVMIGQFYVINCNIYIMFAIFCIGNMEHDIVDTKTKANQEDIVTPRNREKILNKTFRMNLMKKI